MKRNLEFKNGMVYYANVGNDAILFRSLGELVGDKIFTNSAIYLSTGLPVEFIDNEFIIEKEFKNSLRKATVDEMAQFIFSIESGLLRFEPEYKFIVIKELWYEDCLDLLSDFDDVTEGSKYITCSSEKHKNIKFKFDKDVAWRISFIVCYEDKPVRLHCYDIEKFKIFLNTIGIK